MKHFTILLAFALTSCISNNALNTSEETKNISHTLLQNQFAKNFNLKKFLSQLNEYKSDCNYTDLNKTSNCKFKTKLPIRSDSSGKWFFRFHLKTNSYSSNKIARDAFEKRWTQYKASDKMLNKGKVSFELLAKNQILELNTSCFAHYRLSKPIRLLQKNIFGEKPADTKTIIKHYCGGIHKRN